MSTSPEIPAILRPSGRRSPVDFFPISPKTTENKAPSRPAAADRAADSSIPPQPSSRSDDGSREEYISIEEEEEDSAVEVRSGRLDTLGWVSASWEPRRVVLRTDGSMSVEPLGMARRSGGRRLSQSHHRHDKPGTNDGSDSSGVSAASAAASRAAATAAMAAKALGGLAPSWNDLPSPPHWISLGKAKTAAAAAAGNKNGNGVGVIGPSASISARTEGMTTWASNSSNTSTHVKSGTSARLANGLQVAGAAGGGEREQPVTESPTSSAASVTSSADKRSTRSDQQPHWSKIVKGLKRMGPSKRGEGGPPSSVGDGLGTSTFDTRAVVEEDATRESSFFEEAGRGARGESDDEGDDADDVDLAEWEVSRVGKRAGDDRYVVQLRQPSTGSFLLLGTEDPLAYQEWVEDVLYVQQRTLALEWTRRFRSKMAKDPAPPLSAFKFLPDRDWNREWETACSLTGGGRGGRDPRVTIALGQQFRAFVGAVAGAALRASLPQRQWPEERAWKSLAPLRPVMEEGREDVHNGVRKEDAGDVRMALSRATPDDCCSFLAGNVAFLLTPRGSGSGYKTHKRLGAELKGAQVLRRAVERRVLSSVGSGGAGSEAVNALAPLSCVVDLHGFRAAAVALPAFKPRSRSRPRPRTRPKLLGTISWAFSSVHGLDGGGKPDAKWGYDIVRKLISEQIGLSKAEDPHLSIARGVLTGDGKIRASEVEEGKDPSSSPPATVVLFPDLLPAEDVLLARLSGAGDGGAGAAAPSEPVAVWGAEDVVRAVVVPQDSDSPLRTYATLDLAVAAASVAAAAAERAAEMGDIDRWVRRPSPKRSQANGHDSGAGHGEFDVGGGNDEGGEGREGEADRGETDRASLIVEAVSALLGCRRESVAMSAMPSHGLDLFYKEEAARPAALASSRDNGSGRGGSLFASSRDGGSGRGGSFYKSSGSVFNERASGLSGRIILGDAVVVLVDGGMRHGAAGSGDVDGDGSANRDRACNPLRLREELMRGRMQLRPSIETAAAVASGEASSSASDGAAAVAAVREGSAFISETLLPRLAGRLASDALVGGSLLLGQPDQGGAPLFLFEGGHLCAAMHGAGINLRYLPYLRRSLGWEHEGTRQLIASEMLARTAKHVLACNLRVSRVSAGIEDEASVPASSSDERARAVARRVLNAVLFRTYSSDDARGRIFAAAAQQQQQQQRRPSGRETVDGLHENPTQGPPSEAASAAALIGDASQEPPPMSRLNSVEKLQQRRGSRTSTAGSITSLHPPLGRASSQSHSESLVSPLGPGGFMSGAGSAFCSGSTGGDAHMLSRATSIDHLSIWGSVASPESSSASSTALSMAGEAAVFWEVESRLWLLLGPYGSVGGLEFDKEEASSHLHFCRGLSGLHLLPSLTRNLGVVLTVRAIRKLQEGGVATRIKVSHIDYRTGGPAAVGCARFKGLGEEVAVVKRRLRDKCRRRWVATRGVGGRGAGIGWTGASGEERAEYAVMAEDVLGPFVDAQGRGEDLAYARREIAEAHMAVSVADWAEGNPHSARREAERALRALLEGKLGYVDKDEATRRDGRTAKGEEWGGGAEGAGGVPVPVGLTVAAIGMLLAAYGCSGATSGRGSGSARNGGGRAAGEGLSGDNGEEALLWLWRVLQVHFPGRSSTLDTLTLSGPRDPPLWGSHPLVPAIACMLVGKSAGDLSSDSAGEMLTASVRTRGARRDRKGVMDWMANQLKTGPFPGNHLSSLLRRKNGSHRFDGGGRAGVECQLDPADAMARLVSLLLKREDCLVERWCKLPSFCMGGAAELLAPPDTFAWLLGAIGGGDEGDPPPFTVLPKQIVNAVEALRANVRSVPGRLYVDGNVVGLSAEEEAEKRVHDAESNADGALKMLPVRIPTEWQVVQVACGFRHSAIVTASGLVLTLGHGETGRLGHGDEEDALQPKVVRALADTRQLVVWAACGREHTLVALASGSVYSWGWGEGGRLGHGEVGAVLSPRRVEEFDNLGVRIARVSCGREHSLAVSDAGRLYAFGPSDGGRLGFQAVPGAGGVSAPRIVRAPSLAEERVVSAAGGQMHSSCVCASGKVFTWGHGRTGALGHGVEEDEPIPRMVVGFGREAAEAARNAPQSSDAQPDNPKQTNGNGLQDDPDGHDAQFLATSVSCGAWHTLVLTRAGNVHAFGDGFTGQLGLADRGGGADSRVLRPRVVRIERNAGGGGGMPGDVRVTEVACGNFSSAVVSSEGNLYHWGKPDAFSDDEPVTDPRYLLPRRVTSGRGGAAPAYRLVAQGASITLGVADGVRTDPGGGRSGAPPRRS